MMNLAAVEAELPPGFRFHPKDEELVCDYLGRWLMGDVHHSASLIEVDLNKSEPWDIPEFARVGGKDWYFYSRRDRKYATGARTNRATISGYWKATGKDRSIHRKGILVGSRKTLVFYHGRAPNGRKTEWVMHEFRLKGAQFDPKLIPSIQEDWVLCRVFCKRRDKNKQPNFQLHSSSTQLSFDQGVHFQQVPCFSTFTNPSLSQMDALINTSYDLFQDLKFPEDQNVSNCLPGVEASRSFVAAADYLYGVW